MQRLRDFTYLILCLAFSVVVCYVLRSGPPQRASTNDPLAPWKLACYEETGQLPELIPIMPLRIEVDEGREYRVVHEYHNTHHHMIVQPVVGFAGWRPVAVTKGRLRIIRQSKL